MKKYFVIILVAVVIFSACSPSAAVPSPDLTQASLVLTHGTLIDGTGAPSLADATVVIGTRRILAVGRADQLNLPVGVKVIDLTGAYILPGFINAHVHDAYNADRLRSWAQAGVTTVRDEGMIDSSITITDALSLHDQLAISPQYARLITTGYMLTVPGGYGMLEVGSSEEARQAVNRELGQGVDQIKLALESGYAGVTNLPLLTADEIKAIVEITHSQGSQVTAHITEARYLPLLLEAGVDDLAHVPAGFISKTQIQELIDNNIYVVPTLTVFEAYGGLQFATSTLAELVKGGVSIAMGNDYTLVPQNNFNHFELGMPMHEINRMHEAGMAPMQIIVASTQNAAHVCGLEDELGTLEVGKIADILVIGADPLKNLTALTQVEIVIHDGVIIRE